MDLPCCYPITRLIKMKQACNLFRATETKTKMCSFGIHIVLLLVKTYNYKENSETIVEIDHFIQNFKNQTCLMLNFGVESSFILPSCYTTSNSTKTVCL